MSVCDSPGAKGNRTRFGMYDATKMIDKADNSIKSHTADVRSDGKNAAGGVLVNDLLKFGGGIVKRFVPRDAFPFVYAA